MNKKLKRREGARNSDTRAPRRFVDNETIMVKPNAGADIPVSNSNLILDERRLLSIPAAIRKAKLRLQAGLELRAVGNYVLQRFVDRTEECICSSFPVIPAPMPRKVSANITFTKSSLTLRNVSSLLWV